MVIWPWASGLDFWVQLGGLKYSGLEAFSGLSSLRALV